MEFISELPGDFLDELELDRERKDVLIAQINRFNCLSERELPNKNIKIIFSTHICNRLAIKTNTTRIIY